MVYLTTKIEGARSARVDLRSFSCKVWGALRCQGVQSAKWGQFWGLGSCGVTRRKWKGTPRRWFQTSSSLVLRASLQSTVSSSPEICLFDGRDLVDRDVNCPPLDWKYDNFPVQEMAPTWNLGRSHLKSDLAFTAPTTLRPICSTNLLRLYRQRAKTSLGTLQAPIKHLI